MKNVRNAVVSGMFYPDNAVELKDTIMNYLSDCEKKEDVKEIFGLIAPHAGYTYSGKTSAHAYKQIMGKEYSKVIVISPSHREFFHGISVYNGDAYSTPLGTIEVDQSIRRLMVNNSDTIFSSEKGHNAEHALEVHLPFLQTVLGEFKIVPLVMGDQSINYINELSEKLAEVWNDHVLIVASSDLSHFYPGDKAEQLDSLIEKRIDEFDFEGLYDDLANKNCEACGGGPMITLMKAASLRGFKNSKILSRTNSGDITGDYSEVVGYLSAVIYDHES